jgi:hypothetical protein
MKGKIRIVVTGGALLASFGVATIEADSRQRPQASATTGSQIARARASYKSRRDAASLLILFGRLRVGISRKEVERLLGKPSYSPIEGQYYYGSDAFCSHDVEGPSGPCGVVVEYRKPPEYVLTGYLQSCWFGAIRE